MDKITLTRIVLIMKIWFQVQTQTKIAKASIVKYEEKNEI